MIMCLWAGVAQLVEHGTENPGVGGSSPPLGTMARTHQQVVAELEKDLDEDLIATRPTQWGEVPYIESHTVIRQANRIFGYGNWERVLTMPPTKIGDGYLAAVRVTVHLFDERGHFRRVIHEDVGYRKVAKDGFEETAIKGAVSDALKRCLRAFGAQFGLDIGLQEDEDEPIRKLEERKVRAIIKNVTKTAGEAKWPYEVEFFFQDAQGTEALPAYAHDLDKLIKPDDAVILTITRSKAGNAYIKSVEKIEK